VVCFNEIEADGTKRLAGVLGQCRKLVHLNLSGLGAGVLGQYPSLAHLDLSENGIESYGAARLARV